MYSSLASSQCVTSKCVHFHYNNSHISHTNDRISAIYRDMTSVISLSLKPISSDLILKYVRSLVNHCTSWYWLSNTNSRHKAKHYHEKSSPDALPWKLSPADIMKCEMRPFVWRSVIWFWVSNRIHMYFSSSSSQMYFSVNVIYNFYRLLFHYVC